MQALARTRKTVLTDSPWMTSFITGTRNSTPLIANRRGTSLFFQFFMHWPPGTWTALCAKPPNDTAHLRKPLVRQYALERRNAACVRWSGLFGAFAQTSTATHQR